MSLFIFYLLSVNSREKHNRYILIKINLIQALLCFCSDQKKEINYFMWKLELKKNEEHGHIFSAYNKSNLME